MSVASNARVIIKRKKISADGGHHGGAWKVAYADFVTAMMAFFMLMWLLNATTEKQRKGIADYFSPTIPINRISGGGDGNLGGDSVFTEQTLAQNGVGASASTPARRDAGASGQLLTRQDQQMRDIERMLLGGGGEMALSQNALRHVVTRLTDEGLVVELFATEEEPLFIGESDSPTLLMRELVAAVGRVFGLAENGVAVKGYSRSHPIVLAHNPVWDGSLDRADRVRVLLQPTLGGERMQRVQGHADRQPVTQDPMSARNDRIEVVLLRPDS